VHPVFFHIRSLLIPSYGAMSAVGVLLGLILAQRTARIVGLNTGKVWNLCVAGLFSALIAQRLLLVLLNWSDIRLHPQWMLALSMIQHPLLTGAGALSGVGMAAFYALRGGMPLAATADALAAPLSLGLAFEQFGALFAGSGFGTETTARWAVTYSEPLAARWSGTPLGVPLHPVQVYAALAFLTLSLWLLVLLPARRQQGDIAGLWLVGAGVTVFITEFWRDREGRGSLLHGALNGPQAAAILFVIAGALVMLQRRLQEIEQDQKQPEADLQRKAPGTGLDRTISAENEANHG
jgi:phosphatidylglycerol:prolipoprotein diacylglycerol transferase